MDVNKNVTAPCCCEQSTIKGDCYRFSILTPQLVRMEYAADGVFEDRPTQLAVNRNFPPVSFEVHETESSLQIRTEALDIFYDKGPFTPNTLQVKVRSECCGIYCTWNYGDPINEGLGGTARTLDQAEGEIPLDPGIQSRIGGFGVLDDKDSSVVEADGSLHPRRSGIEDIYFFGYGFAYHKCLRNFFHLSGRTPLLPRYALGNWWSRFHAYTEEEYLGLMDQFRKARIPMAVAVIDMDWHLRDINPKYGKGWTGFTWNRKLFKDPAAFLDALHDRNLKTTLNVHPAEGIQPHEEMYEQASRDLGRDPSLEQPILFDFCDPEFIKVYFQDVIHPLKAQGVDFWWLDWQQGTISRTPHIDPLWLVNYYHFEDECRDGKRPMILSRYAGPGSHRYPIGFSGDSIISWKTLDFQPYFTATAANIGYGWWSHDIGGHAAGHRDVELQTRWIQFGVFSPIFRLHSTSNMFNGKEPWRYPEPAKSIMADFMRLRHQLLPYLYTMNWRCHTSGEMLVEPIYYQYPKNDEAYRVKNQYFFGSELMVAPITQPAGTASQRGCCTVWLPENDYFDFFSGMHYTGKRMMNVYRPLQTMPVFAKPGAIVPLTSAEEAEKNGVLLPKTLEIKVFGGADGHFALYEDDGETMAYQDKQYAETHLEFQWRTDEGATIFTITPECFSTDFLPELRTYVVCFVGVNDTDDIRVDCNGEEIAVVKTYSPEEKMLSVAIPVCQIASEIEISIPAGLSLKKNNKNEMIYEILNDCTIGYELKDLIYRTVLADTDCAQVVSELQAMNLPQDVLGALLEVILAE